MAGADEGRSGIRTGSQWKALGLFLLLLVPSRGAAWQSDVHYGLTLFLAYEAGFSVEQAREIACADLGLDRGWRSAVPQVALILIGSKISERSQQVHHDHFASATSPPALPPDRKVAAKAAHIVDRVKQAGYPGFLGEALHALQDSWSHQGEPDSPFRPFVRVRPDYTWAHPEDRDGWRHHSADLTHLHEKEVMAMAEVVYGLLRDSGLRRDRKPAKWGKLRARVGKLAEADTKKQKEAWLRELHEQLGLEQLECSLTSRPEILHERWSVDLPDGGLEPFDSWDELNQADKRQLSNDENEARDECLSKAATPEIMELETPPSGGSIKSEPWPPPETLALLPRATESDLDEFLEGFLKAWLQDQKPDLERVSLEQIGEMLDSSYSTAGPEEWAKSYFRGWLVADHGFVAESGHFDPRLGKKALVKPEEEEEPRLRRIPKNVVCDYSHLLLPLGREHLVLVGAVEGRPSERLALLRFRHAPNDLVILGLARDESGDWEVNQLRWIAL